jgi:hypothetical protein
VAGVVGLGTVTARFATAENGADDGTGAHIVEIGDGAEQFRSAGFEGGKRFGHGAPCCKYYILTD